MPSVLTLLTDIETALKAASVTVRASGDVIPDSLPYVTMLVSSDNASFFDFAGSNGAITVIRINSWAVDITSAHTLADQAESVLSTLGWEYSIGRPLARESMIGESRDYVLDRSY